MKKYPVTFESGWANEVLNNYVNIMFMYWEHAHNYEYGSEQFHYFGIECIQQSYKLYLRALKMYWFKGSCANRKMSFDEVAEFVESDIMRANSFTFYGGVINIFDDDGLEVTE